MTGKKKCYDWPRFHRRSLSLPKNEANIRCFRWKHTTACYLTSPIESFISSTMLQIFTFPCRQRECVAVAACLQQRGSTQHVPACGVSVTIRSHGFYVFVRNSLIMFVKLNLSLKLPVSVVNCIIYSYFLDCNFIFYCRWAICCLFLIDPLIKHGGFVGEIPSTTPSSQSSNGNTSPSK